MQSKRIVREFFDGEHFARMNLKRIKQILKALKAVFIKPLKLQCGSRILNIEILYISKTYKFSRGGGIRTPDLFVPNEAR